MNKHELTKKSTDDTDAPHIRDGKCPVYVFLLNDHDLVVEAKLKDAKLIPGTTKVTAGATFYDDAPKFNVSQYLIGYDVETQAFELDNGDPALAAQNVFKKPRKSPVRAQQKLLSHQWYFSFPKDRFGIILVSDRRITDNAFNDFIRKLTPNDDRKLSEIWIAAHFSRIEAGWLIPSFKKVEKEIDGEKFVFLALEVPRKRKQWTDKIRLKDHFTRVTKKVDKTTGQKIDVPAGIWLRYVDSMNLTPVALSAIGKNIKIEKLDHDSITEMEKLLHDKPELFLRYGIRDSVISAEAFAHYANSFNTALGLKPQSRLTKYSEAYFRGFLHETFSTSRKRHDWKRLFGWERDQNNVWRLAPHMPSFLPFYYGGRNEVLQVGTLGPATYHDLKSAYPTAGMMVSDYNYNIAHVVRGKAAEAKIDELFNDPDGPFQVAGVIAHFRFKDGVQPVFPVRALNGLIFPQTGYGALMWPEVWICKELGLLEHFAADSVFTFERLYNDDGSPSRKLGNEILRLLDNRRGEHKQIYKDLLNFFYGKTAQGVQDANTKYSKLGDVSKARTSSITCFPLSAYVTSVCRAVVGELLFHNDCYAITTDGFISPQTTLTHGPIAKRIQDVFDQNLNRPGIPREFDFIQTEFFGEHSLFLKTRGYLLFCDNHCQVNQDGKDHKMLKLARMNTQTDKTSDMRQIESFLENLIQKRFTRKSWIGFKDWEKLDFQLQAKLRMYADSTSDDTPDAMIPENLKRATLANYIPTQVESKSLVNTTFDMKRIPDDPQPDVFAYKDLTFEHTKFRTKPLYSADDYVFLRMAAKPNMTTEDYQKLADRYERFRK